jgi:hypothetical protein
MMWVDDIRGEGVKAKTKKFKVKISSANLNFWEGVESRD